MKHFCSLLIKINISTPVFQIALKRFKFKLSHLFMIFYNKNINAIKINKKLKSVVLKLIKLSSYTCSNFKSIQYFSLLLANFQRITFCFVNIRIDWKLGQIICLNRISIFPLISAEFFFLYILFFLKLLLFTLYMYSLLFCA